MAMASLTTSGYSPRFPSRRAVDSHLPLRSTVPESVGLALAWSATGGASTLDPGRPPDGGITNRARHMRRPIRTIEHRDWALRDRRLWCLPHRHTDPAIIRADGPNRGVLLHRAHPRSARLPLAVSFRSRLLADTAVV